MTWSGTTLTEHGPVHKFSGLDKALRFLDPVKEGLQMASMLEHVRITNNNLSKSGPGRHDSHAVPIAEETLFQCTDKVDDNNISLITGRIVDSADRDKTFRDLSGA